jgi:hypothetical protein
VRAIYAYAPALVVLAIGIAALVVVPPTEHPLPCNCPTGPAYNTTVCSCPPGYSVDLLGAAVFLAAVVAAPVLALVVHGLRRRSRKI